MLVDTDVLIWCLRGNTGARRTLDKLKHYTVSSVTVMELLQGVRDKQELRTIRAFLAQKHITHIVIDAAISAKAIALLERFSLSHNLAFPDALVAATAKRAGLTLLTGNRQDYSFISGLKIRPFKP
ncbi:MAG: type II toxin-antitoxin system VapC family toxin [Candidatus Omnitrophica bacterium]|nr:type II toxin-antitoxin system VapC family toxin [Candidatus Omnitrophota bacterium]